MGKLFILLGIHVKNKEKGAEKTLKGGGGEVTMTHQLQKSTPTWARISSDRNEFCTLRGGGTTADSNAPGSFLVSPPSGRGLVIPVFFLGGQLAPDLRSVKTILAGNFRSFRVYSPEFS